MQTNRTTASPRRAAVRRLGRLSTGGRGRTGLGEAVRWWGGGVAGGIGRLVGRGAVAEAIIGSGGGDANRSPGGASGYNPIRTSPRRRDRRNSMNRPRAGSG